MRLLAFSIAATLAVTITAQQRVEEPVHVTAIEIVADIRDSDGSVPGDLGPDDFVLLEDGIEQRVIGVDYFSRSRVAESQAAPSVGEHPPTTRLNRRHEAGWQVVLFFDLYLSSPATILSAVDALMARADDLAGLGQVSIVTSRPDLDFILLDTTESEAIRDGLRAVRSKPARNWLVRHRRQYQMRNDMARGRPLSTDLSVMAQMREQEEYVRSEILAEVDAVERFQAALLDAVGTFRRRTPRALFVITEGFELDSAAFYQKFATDLEDIRRMRANPVEYNVGETVESMARVLAAAGWTTYGIHAPLAGGDQWLDDASRSSIGRVSAPRAEEASLASERGQDPLLTFADETGGVAGTPGMVGASVSRLEEALIVTYQISRPPDGNPRSIELRSRRPGLTVRAFRWATESTPSELAATRTLSLFSDRPMGGADLPTRVSLDWIGRSGSRREGMITVRSSLQEMAHLLQDRQTVFRVTVAITRKNHPPMIVHRTITPEGLPNPFEIRIPIQARDRPIEVAATVEELTTGLWGGGRAAM